MAGLLLRWAVSKCHPLSAGLGLSQCPPGKMGAKKLSTADLRLLEGKQWLGRAAGHTMPWLPDVKALVFPLSVNDWLRKHKEKMNSV